MSKELPALDSIDKRLIRELDGNARLSFADLAARLKIPPETARYRVNALIESGVITAFYSVIDAGRLGCSVHKALLKLHNVNEAAVSRIVEFLVAHPAVNWVVRMDNVFDLSFTMWVSSIAEVSSFIDELKGRFHQHIARVALSVNIEAEFLSRDPALNRRRESRKRTRYTVPKGRQTIDKADFEILSILGSNPRAAATAIAAKVGLTSETVAKRITGLERRGIITAYRLVVDSSKLGEANFYILVYMNVTSSKRRDEFVELCRANPRVNYLIKALGEWDYELNVEVKDMAECRTLMMELTKEFSDIIRDYVSIPVGAIYKFMIMPPAAFELMSV